MISGWSTRKIPILAPLLLPPCLTSLVAASKIRMKETGPEAVPLEVLTMEPLGRSRLKEKPVPPPVWWIRACHLRESKIPTRESSTGRTKQAEYCSIFPVPAFIRVGELGKNSLLDKTS